MRVKINYRSFITNILWTLLMLPIYKLGYTEVSPMLDRIYDIGRFISIPISILLLVKYIRVFLRRRVLLFIWFSKFYIVIVTMLFRVHNRDVLYSFILVIVQGIFFTYMLKKDKDLAISTFMLVFEVIVYINLITLILYPEGMYNFRQERIFTIIGHANNTLYYTLPLVALALIKMKENKRIRPILDLGVCILSTVLVGSATATVVYIIFACTMLFEWKNKRAIHFDLFTIYMIILLLSCGFIFFNIQNFFSLLLKGALNRTLDFTGRTFYWNRTLSEIVKSPIIGHGNIPGDQRYGGLTAHSYLLEILYEGGIILFLIFTGVYFAVSKKLNNYINSFYARIFFSATAALTFTCISESNISNSMFFVLLIWASLIDLFCRRDDENYGKE